METTTSPGACAPFAATAFQPRMRTSSSRSALGWGITSSMRVGLHEKRAQDAPSSSGVNDFDEKRREWDSNPRSARCAYGLANRCPCHQADPSEKYGSTEVRKYGSTRVRKFESAKVTKGESAGICTRYVRETSAIDNRCDEGGTFQISTFVLPYSRTFSQRKRRDSNSQRARGALPVFGTGSSSSRIASTNAEGGTRPPRALGHPVYSRARCQLRSTSAFEPPEQGAGFEPAWACAAGFADRPLQPLGNPCTNPPARPEGFEPPTTGFGVTALSQLSYRRIPPTLPYVRALDLRTESGALPLSYRPIPSTLPCARRDSNPRPPDS